MFGQNDNNQDQNQPFNPALNPALGDNTPPSDQPNDSSFTDDTPANSYSQNEFNSPAPSTDQSAAPPPSNSASDPLLGIKQQALQQLSPLVSHLDQTPEEKFRTTMMMIQAADDQSLIAQAYESANQITDEKARAQALLDIVNEINYFTQQHNS